jgi:hypothetical protein
VDFISRCVAIQSRVGGQGLALYAKLGQRAGARGKALVEALRELRPTESVFVGDEVYTLGAGGRWFRREVEWWQRPLWSLDALQAAGSAWTISEVSELHGTRTTRMEGSIDRVLLKEIDPFWHELLGRRATDDLPTQVWLDDAGRAMRIAWTLPSSQLKRREWPSWRVTEFWDWGLPVTIAAPPT